MLQMLPDPLDHEGTDMNTEIIDRIAKQFLDIDTLESRHSDGLDFHDLAVWSINKALRAAFDAGVQSVSSHSTAKES